MLCDACGEHFTFACPDVVLRRKKKAIRDAVDHGFDASHVKNLKSDYERYKHALNPQRITTQFPCPWNTREPLEVPFPVNESFPVWQLEKPRLWREVQDSATLFGCDLCERLVAMIQNHATAKVDESAKITSVWFVERGSHTPRWLRFDLKEGSSSVLIIRFHSAVEDVEKKNSALQLSTPQGTSTMDETCMKFLSESLAHCLSQHPLCSLGHDNWIPTRLLDTHRDSSEQDYIRVVERKDAQAAVANMRVNYLTLSHVWGRTHPLTLTEGNYNDMKIAITIDLLSQCFLDAVNITRRLGIRYLWIDSLCIVQDSTKDWEEEAATMAKVYRNGVCNLAACNGTDSTHSLFVQRNPRIGGSFTVIQKYAEQTVEFTLIPDWVNLTWDSAPLYTRGWAVQERFLSTRVMHFSKFPFWECGTTLTTEVYTSWLERNILCFPELPETQRKWLSSSKDAESSVWLWWKLIKIYTRCSLTVKTDKLIALSGMAETFSKFINEPYLAGIWGGQYLLLGLLWRVEKGAPRGELGSGDYRAPSWSWASRDGMVSLYPYRKILQPLIQIVSIHTVPKSRDLFGQLISGELVLKGFLFEVSSEKGHRKDLRFPGEKHLDYQSLEPFKENIYFLPIAELLPQSQNQELKGMRPFTGIFLQVTKNSQNLGKQVFNRIGDCGIMYNGGKGFILDIPLWKRLLDLHSPIEFGEELVII